MDVPATYPTLFAFPTYSFELSLVIYDNMPATFISKNLT
jgi:hypothetical protein